MIKKLISVSIFLFSFAGFAQNVEELLTSDAWNISYNISEHGVRTDEQDANAIRGNWVKFNQDGTFETPGGVNGKNVGRWSYDGTSNMISFNERGAKYRAMVEEISDMGLLLNYIDNGGFKIGLIHYVYIPKEKSNEELSQVLTSGKWLVTLRRFEDITDKTTPENQQDTWYVFNADGTYQKSEIVGEEASVSDGAWFLDEQFQLNLDSGENTVYSVIGDDYTLILTTISGGYNTIEFKKSKEE